MTVITVYEVRAPEGDEKNNERNNCPPRKEVDPGEFMTFAFIIIVRTIIVIIIISCVAFTHIADPPPAGRPDFRSSGIGRRRPLDINVLSGLHALLAYSSPSAGARVCVCICYTLSTPPYYPRALLACLIRVVLDAGNRIQGLPSAPGRYMSCSLRTSSEKLRRCVRKVRSPYRRIDGDAAKIQKWIDRAWYARSTCSNTCFPLRWHRQLNNPKSKFKFFFFFGLWKLVTNL